MPSSGKLFYPTGRDSPVNVCPCKSLPDGEQELWRPTAPMIANRHCEHFREAKAECDGLTKRVRVDATTTLRVALSIDSLGRRIQSWFVTCPADEPSVGRSIGSLVD